MKTLKQALENNTQDLRAEYLNQVEEWANERYDVVIKPATWDAKKWCKYFNLEPRLCNPGTSTEFWGMPREFYNSRNSRTQDTMKRKATSALRLGKEGFVKEELQRAENHYQSSLEKLVYRLVQKGIAENRGHDIKIHKARVGVNLEMLISVDDIKVKAWTIIAAENSQYKRPHYRYLVK